ncbi:disulfide bond formation protein B [Candidatus Parcubacteria bacterium]|nr:disulfide bond formation protein B [Candidatus Parcubacteria bacterium]
MTHLIQTALPYIVVASHVLLVILFFAAISHKSWGKDITHFIGKHALLLGSLIALGAVSGSLFYSEIVKYEPCTLCWWQRIFIYSQLPIFLVALKKKDRSVFTYSLILSILAGILALYQSYVYMGGTSILPCTALGGACSKNYVMEFGYISIPSMSLTVVLYFLIIGWFNRLYKHENSHS